MSTARFIILILLFSSSQMVAAGLYKCKSANGISYSQKPCASGSESQRLKHIQSAPSAKPDTFNRSGKASKIDTKSSKASSSDPSAPYIRRTFKTEEEFVENMFSRRPITDPEELLDSGVKSFKLVLDYIYEEIGRPAFTKAFSKAFDRKIFSRRDVQAPRFEPDVSISWNTYSDRVSALISCCTTPREVQVIWRPDQSIEIVQD